MIKHMVSGIARKILPMSLRNVVRPYWHRIEEQLRVREIAALGPAERWAALQREEIDFWDSIFADPGWYPDKRIVSHMAERTDPELPLQPYVRERIIAPPGSCVEILDVGAGPLTVLGKKWPGRTVRIMPVDANADEYDKLLAKHGIKPLCRTIFGYAEDLSNIAPSSTFDLVHARNCIDHSKDPLKAISEMVRAVKPRCFVVLVHKISEGRIEKYAGPHQWNLFPQRGRFYVDRPGIRPIDVGEKLLKGIADIADITTETSEEQQWFSVAIRRRH